MIALKNAAEIDAIEKAGRILAALFREIEPRVAAGVSTAELDSFAEGFIRSHDGAEPAFKGLYGFPASLCTSINEEVVHGIPSPKRRLAEGDIVSVDAGVKLDGWFADAARTFGVGAVDEQTAHLLATTQRALEARVVVA